MALKEIKASEISRNAIDLIKNGWLLATAGDESAFNTMTISWGALGEIWGHDAAFVFVRESRYTREFFEKCSHFSLTAFGDGYKKDLTCLGTVSGRDGNKLAQTGLTPVFGEKAPGFAQAELTLICRKLFVSDYMDEQHFVDKALFNQIYKNGDLHKMFVGQIEKVLVRE